jgi:hypothetical protein
MGAPPEVRPTRHAPGFAPTRLESHIDQALATRDPVLANLRITWAHYELSLALRAILGGDSGANFHTWATWGSKKAGTTIRQEDVPHLPGLTRLVGAGLGLLGAAIARPRGLPAPLVALPAGALLGSWALHTWSRQRLTRASLLILGGNRTVLDDIGRPTARFVRLFAGQRTPYAPRLAAFLATLRPGPTAAGGQDLLRHAFTHYYQASHALDIDARHEHMLLANLYAILHEHIRLQPYIAGAMPFLARRLITRRLLDFSVGQRTLRVSEDVVPVSGDAWSATLAHLENAELRDFLTGPHGWDRTPDSLRGSRAANWADIHDRMNFICDLFRACHSDPSLFRPPYSPAQRAAITAGRIPRGPL